MLKLDKLPLTPDNGGMKKLLKQEKLGLKIKRD